MKKYLFRFTGNKNCFLFFFIFSLFVSVYKTNSQEYFFDNYSINDGLAQTRVYSIVQDENGYIWLGTLEGVSRFDGMNFNNYTSSDGLTPGGVKTMIIDSLNRIWFGHLNGGLSLYDGKIFHEIDTNIFKNNKDITTITLDHDNTIWIGTLGNGAFRIINPYDKKDKLTFENYKGGQLSDIVFEITMLFNHELFLITDLGIKKYVNSSNTFVSFLPEGVNSHFFKTFMLQDTKGNIWYGTHNGGLIKHNFKSGEFINYLQRDGLATDFIWTIFEDSKGNIWTSNIDTRSDKGGITKISSEGFKAYNKSNGLQDDKINCIFEDKEGNILLGTRNHGLSIFKGEKFLWFPENKINGLCNKNVNAIYEDHNNNIWFGTEEGITVYDTKNNTFKNHTKNNSIIRSSIRCFTSDHKNNIWIGTDGAAVLKYNYRTSRFENDMILNSILYDDREFEGYISALQVSDNILWIGTNNGLRHYNIGKNDLNLTRDIDNEQYEIQGNIKFHKIVSIYLDSKKTLWVGTEGNGVSYSVNNKDFNNITKLENISATCFIEDLDGKIWIGSEGQGLYVYKNDSICRHYTIENGLLSNLIKLLNIDQYGNIYIGTNKGLNKINQNEGTIVSYTKRNGFTGIETHTNSTYKDHNRNIWFGTVNGVVRYNPQIDRHYEDRLSFKPFISSIKVKDTPLKNISSGLKLRYNQNSIDFSFKYINLTNPEAVRYKYMLEGSDEDWIGPTKINYVKYDRLPPGKYNFKAITKNNYGVWSQIPVEYNFIIDKPFYKKLWFVILAIFTALALVYIFIKIRERNLIREKRILESRVKQRTIALSEANNMLEKKNKDVTDSIRYAKRIQFAILPADIPFDNTFVMFRPKDIVSGDFYWMIKHDGLELMAAVDCTGHGVPGAFMSFIGYSSLNKIVKEQNITNTSLILNHLNQEVSIALQKKKEKEEEVKDGMDLALLCYDVKKKSLEYSGAMNPMILIRNNEIIEYKADRIPIGSISDEEPHFTKHTIKINKGDAIYIFSDGYADQFGGEEGKKFKTKNLKDLFLEIHKEDVSRQKKILEKTMDDWKGKEEQIDDILIIGRLF